ncbi:hypothetical protein [uncultured Shewanella sp.]|uniref:hypothetical protein n=1 Tax=uncultured Shewanella sp. TaxID=173975 RepID=UPI002623883B|nr:hypothetical protein [uncultured Shewanella sp.]
MFDAIFVNITATVLGGIILALFFFILKEKVFAIADISGRWHFNMITAKTSYIPYQNMELRYVAVLWRESNKLYGSVEKIYEISSTGERPYTGKDRTRGEISGIYEKNFFSKDKIYIHITEKGKERESTNYFTLSLQKKNLEGDFISFVAEQEGHSSWQREHF